MSWVHESPRQLPKVFIVAATSKFSVLEIAEGALAATAPAVASSPRAIPSMEAAGSPADVVMADIAPAASSSTDNKRKGEGHQKKDPTAVATSGKGGGSKATAAPKTEAPVAKKGRTNGTKHQVYYFIHTIFSVYSLRPSIL